MAPPPTIDSSRPRQTLWWFLILLALILGYFIGRQHQIKINAQAQPGGGGGPLGTCISSDSSVVSRNVTQQTCQSSCKNCSWTPN